MSNVAPRESRTKLFLRLLVGRLPFLCGLLFLRGVTTAQQPEAAPKPEIRWQHELDKAIATARQKKQPILLFLTTTNCRYCVRMKQETLADPNIVGQVSKSFVPVTLADSEAPELVRRLGIKIFPATVVLSPGAEVLESISGYLPPLQFRARLDSAGRKLR